MNTIAPAVVDATPSLCAVVILGTMKNLSVDFSSRIASAAGVRVPTPTLYPVPIPRMLLSPSSDTSPSETNAAAVTIPIRSSDAFVSTESAVVAVVAVPVTSPVTLPVRSPVMFDVMVAGNLASSIVPVSSPAGMLTRPEPEPVNEVAVTTPMTLAPIETFS